MIYRNMYKFIYKKEVIEEVECKDQADELLKELNYLYKGGVTMTYKQTDVINTCYCGHEIETGNFCSRECAKLFFNEIT